MRALSLGTLLIALLAIPALLDRDSGVAIWLELREDLAGSTARVDALVARNDSLRREVELLEADPTAIDRAIREELDLALPGETIIRFRPDDEGVWTLGADADSSAVAGEERHRESR